MAGESGNMSWWVSGSPWQLTLLTLNDTGTLKATVYDRQGTGPCSFVQVIVYWSVPIAFPRGLGPPPYTWMGWGIKLWGLVGAGVEQVRGGVWYWQGSQPLCKSEKTLEMSFQFSSQGKRREFGENIKKNQRKRREFVTVTQKGKVFASLGHVRLVPCVQVVFIG